MVGAWLPWKEPTRGAIVILNNIEDAKSFHSSSSTQEGVAQASSPGNTISDMCGVGSAWYVESLATRLGAMPPTLSPAQLDLGSSRLAANLGRCLGVMLGCLIGMLPLLFLSSSEEKSK